MEIAVDKTMNYVKPITYSMIMARDNRGGIGMGNGLPWGRCKEDMEWFRKNTMGKAIIMGFKTFETLGSKPLKGRLNLVLTTKREFTLDQAIRADVKTDGQTVIYCRSINDAKQWLKTQLGNTFFAGKSGTEGQPDLAVRISGEVMIIGGASIYQQFQHEYDSLYLTTFQGEYPADTFLNINLTPDSWELRFHNSMSRLNPVFEIYSRIPLMVADHGFMPAENGDV